MSIFCANLGEDDSWFQPPNWSKLSQLINLQQLCGGNWNFIQHLHCGVDTFQKPYRGRENCQCVCVYLNYEKFIIIITIYIDMKREEFTIMSVCVMLIILSFTQPNNNSVT